MSKDFTLPCKFECHKIFLIIFLFFHFFYIQNKSFAYNIYSKIPSKNQKSPIHRFSKIGFLAVSISIEMIFKGKNSMIKSQVVCGKKLAYLKIDPLTHKNKTIFEKDNIMAFFLKLKIDPFQHK